MGMNLDRWMDAPKFWGEKFSLSFCGPLIHLSPVYCICDSGSISSGSIEQLTVLGGQLQVFVSRAHVQLCVLGSVTHSKVVFFLFPECIRQAVKVFFFVFFFVVLALLTTRSLWLLLQYYFIACYALLIYDHLLTLGNEVGIPMFCNSGDGLNDKSLGSISLGQQIISR